MTPRCLFCGRRPVEWHHITGRDSPDGRYLDRALVVPLCKRHHAREHEVVLRLGRAFPGEADLLGHRVARLLDFVARLADHRRPLVLDGSVLDGLHALWLDASGALADRVDPA